MRRTGDGEDGVIATQLAVLMPGLLLVLMLAVQFGLWAHASQLARAAADEAAFTAALPEGTDAAAHQAAHELLSQAGNLEEVAIRIETTDDAVSATVTGHAPQLTPGMRWSVQATATAAVERFIPQGQR